MGRPLIMDVDTGIDDALALLLACCSPELDLLACGTVSGNVAAGTAAQNTLRVLEAVGRGQVPVAVGCTRPLVQAPREARGVHGPDGLGDSALPAPRRAPSGEHAVDQILRLTAERPGEVTLVAVGPLTNLAVALARDPGLAGRVAQVIVMGGAMGVPGNTTPVAEANVAHDPEAAQAVLQAEWPLLMVGLDVTMRALFEEDRLGDLARGGTAARLAARILPWYMKAYSRVFQRPCCPLHDPLALACAVDSSWVQTRRLPVAVELRGQWTRGMTVADRRAAPSSNPLQARGIDVAVDVDARGFVDWFVHRLAGG